MLQVESGAQRFVDFKVFHCVRWTATGNVPSFLKVSDSGRYKNRGPYKNKVFSLNIVVTTLSFL